MSVANDGSSNILTPKYPNTSANNALEIKSLAFSILWNVALSRPILWGSKFTLSEFVKSVMVRGVIFRRLVLLIASLISLARLRLTLSVTLVSA